MACVSVGVCMSFTWVRSNSFPHLKQSTGDLLALDDDGISLPSTTMGGAHAVKRNRSFMALPPSREPKVIDQCMNVMIARVCSLRRLGIHFVITSSYTRGHARKHTQPCYVGGGGEEAQQAAGGGAEGWGDGQRRGRRVQLGVIDWIDGRRGVYSHGEWREEQNGKGRERIAAYNVTATVICFLGFHHWEQ